VACRDFYVRWFGFQVVFEASWFVYLATAPSSPRAASLAFMSPDHPSAPPGPETFDGRGVFFTFQVDDAAAELARLESGGLAIAYPLRDEPWGQRRFAVRDPAGSWIDVIQQIDPAPGFWDPYLPA
jgi:catechol 2,3-dioxygenase-like lactoylglutathione lyase family enzyme